MQILIRYYLIIKRENQLIKKKVIIEYLPIAFIGFIPIGVLGLIFSTTVYFLLKKSFKKKKFVYGVWFFIGLLTFILSSPIYLEWLGRPNPSSQAEATKNQMINGVKECIIRGIDGKTTNFLDSSSFRQKPYHKWYSFKATNPSSCFSVYAFPSKTFDWYLLRVEKPANWLTWFRLDMDPITGEVTKTCGDSTKVGCREGNKW